MGISDNPENRKAFYEQVRRAVDANNLHEAVNLISGLEAPRDQIRILLSLARDLAHELGALQQMDNLGTRTLGHDRDRDLELAYALAYALEIALDVDLEIALATAQALDPALGRNIPVTLRQINSVILRVLPDHTK